MALTDKTLNQIHELQAEAAAEADILLMALTPVQARALLDLANHATRTGRQDDRHLTDVQDAAGAIATGLETTGLLNRMLEL